MTSDLNLSAPVAEISRQARVFCALATALLLWLPAQKLGWFPLAWLGLAPFLWAAGTISASRARFRYGWAAGWLFYALTNWWIVPTVIYGAPMIGAPPILGFILGVIAVAFIAAVHGLQFALAAWLWDEKRWRGKLWLLPLFVAVVWQTFDFLRCVGPLSHIWGALAFSQWRDTALLQIAPFIGQHGITALLVWCGASLVLWKRTRRAVFVLAPFCVFFALHGIGAWWLQRPWWQTRPVQSPISKPVQTSDIPSLLVSTDVPSLRKSGLAAGETPWQEAMRLTLASQEGAVLAIWPETTIEVWEIGGRFSRSGAAGAPWRMIDKLRLDYEIPLLTGATIHQMSGLDEKLYNAALFSGSGIEAQVPVQKAPKIRTVPMGEKAPFGEWIPFLKRFAPNPEVTPGKEPTILKIEGTPVGTVICFESCFPDPARSLVQKGARALFILTNDEWFKGTNAPWEHATMAVMRAAENRVPVAQVANGGYTLLIDSRGRILHQSFGAGATPLSIPLD